LIEEQQKLIGIETNLREFISEIITPFNDRVTAMEIENKSIRSNQTVHHDRLSEIEIKLQTEAKLRETVKDIERHLL